MAGISDNEADGADAGLVADDGLVVGLPQHPRRCNRDGAQYDRISLWREMVLLRRM